MASMDKAAQTLQLRDIHLPSDPSMWPLAPGWWVVIILALLCGYFILRLFLRARKRRQINDVLQQELININKSYKAHKSKHQLAADVSLLLKRFVKHVLDDQQAAALTGDDWVRYLDGRVNNNVFDRFKDVLMTGPYTKNCEFDAPALIAAVKNYFPVAIKLKDKKGNTHA